MNIGDVVVATHNDEQLKFSIVDIKFVNDVKVYKLHCLDYRLVIDSPAENVCPIGVHEVENHARSQVDKTLEVINKILYERSKDYINKIERTTVLHIDSDKSYLDLCMKTYDKLNIEAYGEYIPLEKQAEKIQSLLKKYKPTVLVITGHDVLIKKNNKYSLDSYENSKYFIETIKKARELIWSKSDLIIIAGACQSYYEEIIKAGANFASSPKRVLVHAIDPVLIAERIIYTNIETVVDGKEAVKNTISGNDGFGGIDTLGTLRSLYPNKFS